MNAEEIILKRYMTPMNQRQPRKELIKQLGIIERDFYHLCAKVRKDNDLPSGYSPPTKTTTITDKQLRDAATVVSRRNEWTRAAQVLGISTPCLRDKLTRYAARLGYSLEEYREICKEFEPPKTKRKASVFRWPANHNRPQVFTTLGYMA